MFLICKRLARRLLRSVTVTHCELDCSFKKIPIYTHNSLTLFEKIEGSFGPFPAKGFPIDE